MSKENSLNVTFGTQSLGKGFRREDSAGVIQLRRALSEKDRQLGLLERKLVLAQAEVRSLQEKEQRIKLAEKSAKIQLSANQTAARRQSIALMQASATITKLNSRDSERERRVHLRRDELERELEAAEDLAESTRENCERRVKDLLAAHDEEIVQFRVTIEELSADLQSRQLKHAVEVEALQNCIKSQQETMQSLESELKASRETETRLSQELDECLGLNASMSRDLCEQRLREKAHRERTEQAAQTEPLSADSSQKFEEAKSQVARLEAECCRLSSEMWRLQDLRDAEKDGWTQREEQFQTSLSNAKDVQSNLEAELLVLKDALHLAHKEKELFEARNLALEGNLKAMTDELDYVRDLSGKSLVPEKASYPYPYELFASPCGGDVHDMYDDEEISRLRMELNKMVSKLKLLQNQENKTAVYDVLSEEVVTTAEEIQAQVTNECDDKIMPTPIQTYGHEEQSEIQRLNIELDSIKEAFEVTRGFQQQSTEATCSSIKDLQQLLQRSDAELIKRASRNAALQYEVNRLTELLDKSKGEFVKMENERLQTELTHLTLKFDKLNKLNKELILKLNKYHDVTSSLHQEQLNAFIKRNSESDAQIVELQHNLSLAERKLKEIQHTNGY